MAVAGEIVQGRAAGRGEFRGLGIDQIQGDDVLGDPLQLFVDRGPFHVGLVLFDGGQQFVDRSLVDPARIGVHRHLHARRDLVQHRLGADDGRHVELAGQRRHVAADAPRLDNDGAAGAHDHHIFR